MIKEAKCLIDASPKEVEKELIGIGKTLLKAKKTKPAEKVLAVLLFAGYGVQSAGYQTLLYPELVPETGFFKMLAAEKKVTSWAEIAPNGYFICIFACDRQIYQPDLHVFTHVHNTVNNTEKDDQSSKYKKALKRNNEKLQKYENTNQELQKMESLIKDGNIPIIEQDYEKQRKD